MATSTFGKEFKVTHEKTTGFVKEMTRKVAPTLKKNFQSNLKHEKDLKDVLQKALK